MKIFVKIHKKSTPFSSKRTKYTVEIPISAWYNAYRKTKNTINP